MKKKRAGQCYLCGSFVQKLTDDHLPPKFLAPKEPDSGFSKLPACESCNNQRHSHEENKFRDVVAAAGTHFGNKAADDAFAASLRKFSKDLPNKVNRDFQRILNSLSEHELYSANGAIYLGTASVVELPGDIDYERILLKIARGLTFHTSGVIVPANYHGRASLLSQNFLIENPDMVSTLKTCHVVIRSGNFFAARGGWIKEDPASSIWFIFFYERMLALAAFVDPTRLPSVSE